MTARKNAQADETKADETKTAGTDESKTEQTSTQSRETEVPTEPEVQGETDAKAAASGETLGAVHDGDSGWEEDNDFQAGEVSAALGTVPETTRDGETYEVPWAYLTPEDLGENTKVRTSDSDDPARSWSVQDTEGEGDDAVPVALIPVQETPGQTFRVSELPNVNVMEAAGIDAAQFLSGVPVRADAPDEAPRRGIPA